LAAAGITARKPFGIGNACGGASTRFKKGNDNDTYEAEQKSNVAANASLLINRKKNNTKVRRGKKKGKILRGGLAAQSANEGARLQGVHLGRGKELT